MDRLEKAGRPAQCPAHRDHGDAPLVTGPGMSCARRVGSKHQVQLDVLSASGLLAYDTPRGGWEPELLRALDRAAHVAPP